MIKETNIGKASALLLKFYENDAQCVWRVLAARDREDREVLAEMLLEVHGEIESLLKAVSPESYGKLMEPRAVIYEPQVLSALPTFKTPYRGGVGKEGKKSGERSKQCAWAARKNLLYRGYMQQPLPAAQYAKRPQNFGYNSLTRRSVELEQRYGKIYGYTFTKIG